ncbi:MAG: hypothetical protein DBX36_00680 [Oscillospiraceae bacterium]|nr:MAG: hypothetical protein DBX36_00680 [Oscillospiraceae bacterium]
MQYFSMYTAQSSAVIQKEPHPIIRHFGGGIVPPPKKVSGSRQSGQITFTGGDISLVVVKYKR